MHEADPADTVAVQSTAPKLKVTLPVASAGSESARSVTAFPYAVDDGLAYAAKFVPGASSKVTVTLPVIAEDEV